MARRKSKKSPETEAASPREALTRPNPDASGNASPAASSEAAPSGMVRKSTCIMGMLLTLALGLYLGGLLPGLINGHGPAVTTHPATAQPEAAPPAPPPSRRPGPRRTIRRPCPGTGPKNCRAGKTLLADPKDAARWAALGNLYFDTGQAKQAISAYERSLTFAPGNPDVLTDLGIMYREAGAYEQAVDSFRKASAARPGHENALFNEGVVLYYDLHRKDEAVQAWQSLLKANPGARSPGRAAGVRIDQASALGLSEMMPALPGGRADAARNVKRPALQRCSGLSQ